MKRDTKGTEKDLLKIVIPKDELYYERIKAESLLMAATGYRVKGGIAGEYSTTYIMEYKGTV